MNFKVTLYFSDDTHEFGADKDTYIGEIVERIIDTIGIHYNGLSFGTKFIGYDYQLHKKLSDYEDFKGMSFINCFIAHSSFNYRHAQYKITYPILYYKHNKIFPPTENWNEDDPINLGPFLIYNGWGSGPTNIHPDNDNKYDNLVIIVYLENDKLFKKCVNIIAYTKALVLNSKDIFTQKIVTDSTISDLKLMAVKKITMDNSKKLIPEYFINFQ